MTPVKNKKSVCSLFSEFTLVPQEFLVPFSWLQRGLLITDFPSPNATLWFSPSLIMSYIHSTSLHYCFLTSSQFLFFCFISSFLFFCCTVGFCLPPLLTSSSSLCLLGPVPLNLLDLSLAALGFPPPWSVDIEISTLPPLISTVQY